METRRTQVQQQIRDMDPRVSTLAEALIQSPPGIFRDVLVLRLGMVIQNSIDQWFHDMETP